MSGKGKNWASPACGQALTFLEHGDTKCFVCRQNSTVTTFSVSVLMWKGNKVFILKRDECHLRQTQDANLRRQESTTDAGMEESGFLRKAVATWPFYDCLLITVMGNPSDFPDCIFSINVFYQPVLFQLCTQNRCFPSDLNVNPDKYFGLCLPLILHFSDSFHFHICITFVPLFHLSLPLLPSLLCYLLNQIKWSLFCCPERERERKKECFSFSS